MKARKPLFVLSGIILFFTLTLFSCSTPGKTALACPEYSRYPANKSVANHGRSEKKIFTADNRATKHRHHNNSSGKNRGEYIVTHKNSAVKENNESDDAADVAGIAKIEHNEGLLASIDNSIIPFVRTNEYSYPVNNSSLSEQFTEPVTQPAGCDTIILKSGAILLGKVEEIGQIEVRYRKCDNLNGPVISILKSDISLIKYTNGTHDSIAADKPVPVGNPDLFTTRTNIYAPAKTEGLAIAGFISGIVGLFIAGIPLGTLAVIFGAISLSKIRKYPARYKGRGLAIASVVIGFVAAIGAIIVIAAM